MRKASMEGVGAVTFDFGGTLVLGDLDTEGYKRILLKYLHSIGFSGRKNRLNKAMNGMLEGLTKARNQNREIRFEHLYQGLLFKLGIHPEIEIIEYIYQLYVRSFKVDFVSGARKVLKTLHDKYKLAVISNATSNIPRIALEKYDFTGYFDTIVVSRDIGIRKPDPEIFRFTLNNLSLKSNEAVHVGDSFEDDVQGARNVGMKTIWIRNETEAINTEPDYTIRSLEELTSIL
jgi:putative hydrolase of the HAD superfamily